MFSAKCNGLYVKALLAFHHEGKTFYFVKIFLKYFSFYCLIKILKTDYSQSCCLIILGIKRMAKKCKIVTSSCQPWGHSLVHVISFHCRLDDLDVKLQNPSGSVTAKSFCQVKSTHLVWLPVIPNVVWRKLFSLLLRGDNKLKSNVWSCFWNCNWIWLFMVYSWKNFLVM